METIPFLAIEHVQLAMPEGEEEAARRFYTGILGMREIPKPSELAKRGGVWFASGELQLHLGVDQEFRPAKKAHPALRCADYDNLLVRLRAEGVVVTPDGAKEGVARCHIHDCFGNRIELVKA